jgi:hypothetical protein
MVTGFVICCVQYWSEYSVPEVADNVTLNEPLVMGVLEGFSRVTVINDDGCPVSRVWPAPAVYTSLLLVDEMMFAVTVPAPLMVAEVELDVGLAICISPWKVHEENTLFPLGVAVNVSVAPTVYVLVPVGVVVPLPAGLTLKFTWTWSPLPPPPLVLICIVCVAVLVLPLLSVTFKEIVYVPAVE